MKIVSKDGVVGPIVLEALASQPKVRSADYTVTELLDPPRLRHLQKRHDAEIEVDAIGMMQSFIGQALHLKMETFLKQRFEDSALVERELSMTVLSGSGPRKVSGKPDFYQDGVLRDWKTASVWSWVFDKKDECERQLNLYCVLLKAKAFPRPEKLVNHFWFTDWSPTEAKRYERYPPARYLEVEQKLWTELEQEKFLSERLEIHVASEELPDEALPECSPKDRWAKATTWAVMKEGRKTAIRVLDSEAEAGMFIDSLDQKGLSVEKRPGKDVRCESYCPASAFCSQRALALATGAASYPQVEYREGR